MMKTICLFFILLLVSVPVNANGIKKHEIQLSDNSILVITKKRFNPQEHKIEYSGNGKHKVPFKIDGHRFFPNDFDLPYHDIVSLYLIYQGKRYNLDKSNIYDIGPKGNFTFTCNKNTCNLKIIYGDGAGVMMAVWKIENGKSEKTILTSDLEEIFN